jgi:hypothetical protein
MAVGDSALIGGDSYLAIGRETAFGTYNTCTAALDFISASLKVTKESKTLEQIERSRTFSKRISLSKQVEGEVEFYYAPLVDACNFLLINALGGAVTSATATGETTGGGAFTHTLALGSMTDQSYPSLCINMRKGAATGGKVFEYSGLRVGELSFAAEIDEALKCNVSMIGKDVTNTSNSVACALTVTASPVLSFADGRLSVESSFASLTSSSFWHVQSVEFSLNNNLASDNESRRIGSDTMVVLPPGMAEMELKAKIRFDTTTAWSAMMNATQFSAQFEFLGPTITGSAIRQGIRLDFPRVYITDAGDPEVSDASGVLTSEVTFQVLRDDTTSTGYAVQAKVTNTKSSYA